VYGVAKSCKRKSCPKVALTGITLIGGPAGREGRASWRAVFPNEKHELSADWRAALKTEGRSGGLHKKAVRRVAEKGGADCEKSLPSGPPFSIGQLNVQPTGLSCCAACRPAILCSSPAHGKFMFFIW